MHKKIMLNWRKQTNKQTRFPQGWRKMLHRTRVKRTQNYFARCNCCRTEKGQMEPCRNGSKISNNIRGLFFKAAAIECFFHLCVSKPKHILPQRPAEQGTVSRTIAFCRLYHIRTVMLTSEAIPGPFARTMSLVLGDTMAYFPVIMILWNIGRKSTRVETVEKGWNRQRKQKPLNSPV